MDQVVFLELADIIQIHFNQIEHYGGATDIRDLNLLESAVEQPRATFGGEFLHSSTYEMAAAYLFHIVMNHPFADGNKRTGTVAALVFLDWNGIEIEAEPGEVADLTLAVTAGEIGKKEIAQFFAEHHSR